MNGPLWNGSAWDDDESEEVEVAIRNYRTVAVEESPIRCAMRAAEERRRASIEGAARIAAAASTTRRP